MTHHSWLLRGLPVSKLWTKFLFSIADSIGSCEASFHLEAVVHIYGKSIRCIAKIERCHHRMQVLMNIFDVHFPSFLFRLFACKSTFVSLEVARKNNS